MLRALTIGKKEKKAIKDVLRYSANNKMTHSDLMRICEGVKDPAGTNPKHICTFPGGFRVVFCIEEQLIGWCNHMSVSIDEPGELPSVPEVEVIMNEFGMWGTSLNCDSIWVEGKCHKLPSGELVDAVNLLQKIKNKSYSCV